MENSIKAVTKTPAGENDDREVVFISGGYQFLLKAKAIAYTVSGKRSTKEWDLSTADR
ncbi:hypothetical protein [Rothia sp. P5766]|uniref:hypothetical protein n=1 Tax=Rothia sp. P5766 TaxID=3402656 RepID=UPI003AE124D5